VLRPAPHDAHRGFAPGPFTCTMRSMRKCVRIIAIACCSLVLSASAFGQALKVGYVDMKRVLDNAPQVVSGRQTLDLEFRSRSEAIEIDEFRAKTLEDRLAQGDLTQDAALQTEREFRELQRSINRRKEDLRDELSFRRTEEVQRLEEEINLAVQEIAERNGYDLIISSPVVYASPDLDITDLILDQLEAEFNADQLEQLNR
jgi:outer membrane protein